MTKYVVYCLVKDGKPCYVGVTAFSRLSIRIQEHKKVRKEFDTYKILKVYKTKKEALNAENAIIRLNGLFDLGLINAKFSLDEYYSMQLKESQNGGMD